MKLSTALRVFAHANTFFVGLGASLCFDALSDGRLIAAVAMASQVLCSSAMAFVLDRMAFDDRSQERTVCELVKKRRNCFESDQTDETPTEVP